MSFFSFVGSALTGGLLGAITSLFGSKGTTAPAPLPMATRDDAAQAVRDADALRRRQGAAADIVTGTTGAEASKGSIGKLVVGS